MQAELSQGRVFKTYLEDVAVSEDPLLEQEGRPRLKGADGVVAHTSMFL